MKTEKIIMYGNFYNIVRVFNNFPKLYSYMYLHITDGSDMYDDFGEIPTHTIDILEDDSLKKYNIVISDDNCYEDVTNLLHDKYNIDKKKCIKFRLWLAKMLRKHGDVLLIPESVHLDVCTKCQLNCADCYMRKDNNGVLGAGYTKFSDYKNFVDKNPYIKHIDISNNGEVFLNPDLDKILKYSYSKKVAITIYGGTNFNYVSDDVLKALVTSQVKGISISIDGATNHIYQKYRRNGNLENVINNIKKLNEYKEKYNSDFPYIKCQFIVMEENVHQVKDIANLAEKLGMSIYYKKEWSNKFIPKNRKYIEKLTGLDYNEKPTKNDSWCYQTISSPHINWDGRLLGCCTIYKTDWGKNVFEDGLISVLNSNKYRNNICNLLEGEKVKSPYNPCMNCDSFINDMIYINI